MSPEDERDLRRLVLSEFRLNEQTSATCVGKEAFDSFNMAESILARMRKSKDATKRTIIRKCRFCGKWHICGVMYRKLRDSKPEEIFE
jgi:hypothetical protein